jgi:predicted ATP-grasp superfamily ATP-dependent carboligase
LDVQTATLSVVRFGVTTQLRGLGNIDFIHDGEWSHVIEVNPRYPASMEVLELASGFVALEWHRKGFFRYLEPVPPPPASRVVGKAIYYAARPVTFPASGQWDDSLACCTDVWRMPEFADIPHPGSVIEPGQPVFTLFASAPTEAECVHQLKARAADCDRLFGVPTPEDAP